MSSVQSISLWLAELKEGSGEAAQQLWNRYALKLVELARKRLKNSPKRIGDEEDVAASVFHSVCRGAAAGRFENVRNRDDLWWLLLGITQQKIVDHVRREKAKKRGAGCTRTESGLRGDQSSRCGFTLDLLISEEPSPELLLMLEEQHQRLLGLLRDDRLRQVAMSRIEGFTVPEIAADLQMSIRSVERKLQLIRAVWSKELES